MTRLAFPSRRSPATLATIASMRATRLWLVAFLIIAAVATSPFGLHADAWAHVHGAALPHALLSLLAVVWPLGEPPLTLALLLLLTLDSRIDWPTRWRAWGAMLAVELVEVVFKHYAIGSATPATAIPMPRWWVAAVRHLAVPLPAWVATHLAHFRLRGAFPSGHVLRLTLVANYLVPWPNVVLPALAATFVGVGVVATGGHTLTDALGGAALAFGTLSAIGRLPSVPHRGTVLPAADPVEAGPPPPESLLTAERAPSDR